jgi:hypothetical protein
MSLTFTPGISAINAKNWWWGKNSGATVAIYPICIVVYVFLLFVHVFLLLSMYTYCCLRILRRG